MVGLVFQEWDLVMRYWIVRNGWQGAVAVGVIVEAMNEETAIFHASKALREEAEKPRGGPALRNEHTYSPSYWEPGRLRAERITLPLVCEVDY
jgi:hypothetical protein